MLKDVKVYNNLFGAVAVSQNGYPVSIVYPTSKFERLKLLSLSSLELRRLHIFSAIRYCLV